MRRPGRYSCRSLWFVVVKWDFDDTINSLEQHTQSNKLFGSEPPVPPILKQRSFVSHLVMASSCYVQNGQHDVVLF